MRINSRRGSAKVYIAVIALIAIAVIWMIARLNWRRFKAEASFTMTIVIIVLIAALILFLYIRHKIRKASRNKKAGKDKVED